jgi:spore coat protein H
MSVLKRFKESDLFHTFEVAGIFLFALISLLLIFSNPSQATNQSNVSSSTNNIVAQANAMPNQGWAPMTVYFSAFGSESITGEIISYEWDLDGNGLYDTNATNNNGYTNYTYAKPGEYLVTLRVTDSQGNSTTDSVSIKVRHPASSPVDYWTVFDDSKVKRVDIQISQANWDLMWVDPPSKTTVQADAIIFGEPLKDIGFRMRGQFSLRESNEKKPWKIDTDFYVDGQEYHNLKQLMFINSIGDPTLIQEKLTYDMLAFAGVPASHVCYVEFWIDITDDTQPPIFWGVYTMIERVDRKFLASRFGNDYKYGNLYKASHAQRGPMDLIYYGPHIEQYPTQGGQYAYGKMTNIEENDYSDIINLAWVIDGANYDTPNDFAQALEQVFNVDVFLRYMAAMVTVASWDYYPYTGNNFYLYDNPETGKFEWIPWDQTWGDYAEQPLFKLDGPGLLARAPLYDRVFEVEAYQKKYAAYLDLLTRYWFNYDNVHNQALKFHNLIDPYINQSTGDKMYFGPTALFQIKDFNESWSRLPEFAKERSNFILETLSNYQTPTD